MSIGKTYKYLVQNCHKQVETTHVGGSFPVGMIGLRYDLMNSSAEISSQAKYSPRVGGGGGVNYSVGKLLVLIFSKNLIFMV